MTFLDFPQILINSVDDSPATPVSEKTEAVVEATVDVLSFVGGTLAGVAVGVVATIVVMSISHMFARWYKYYEPIHATISRPVVIVLATLGGWIGFQTVLDSIKTDDAPGWLSWLSHSFLILFIIVVAGFVVALVNGLVKSIYLRMEVSSEERASRIETQVQVIHRVISAVIWVVACGAILLTFPAARTAGTSILASAGILSVVAGLAAQSVLGDVFAGVQLAFSDSMRVGDIVLFNDEMTTVEEITLTYVVLAVWDGRRIMVPSSKMTAEPFENWTRRSPEMMGIVEWHVDWTIPIQQARKQLEHLLQSTDLWDGRIGILQISEATNGLIMMRAIVSGQNAGALIDLRHYLREAMVEWIQNEAPQAIPHYRRIVDDAPNFDDVSEATRQRVDERLAASAPAYKPDKAVVDTASTTVISREELEKFARTPIAQRVGDDEFQLGANSEEFVVVPAEDDGKPAGYQSAIFHGSEEANKRAEQYSGPGEDAYEERNRKIEQTANIAKYDDAGHGHEDAGHGHTDQGE
ncbi:mechanosensitive ion channel family protein [Arcanobacterium phocisimile]|uniref:Mechanosensitive ion channel family protein n=1 Tax=Arcanobacterium phocisimile TaxID=1302235 RepID=A0ABX7IGX8_9ACTO|nr:mechanosensitive ion channel family protein [Arcanobacterium phocisimile]QRV02388.1 mechanosensitive ion channel family protein [Arcanobacterium phocisimile]